jgi:hypothetical protein
MLIEVKGVTLRRAENKRHFFVQHALSRQIVHRSRANVGGTDLEEKIGPQSRFPNQRLFNKLMRPIIGNGEERADEVAVVSKNLGMKIENAHIPPSEESYKNHFLLFSQKEKKSLSWSAYRRFAGISPDPNSDQPGSSTWQVKPSNW